MRRTGQGLAHLWHMFFVAFVGFVACLIGQSSSAQQFQLHSFGNALEAVVITIDGEIEEGASERFRTWLETEPADGFRVRLNSPGGHLIEGILLGSIIREYGFWTEVGAVEYRSGPDAGFPDGYIGPVETPGTCLSACALAFLGGEHRSPKAASKLGFHQFYGGFDAQELAGLNSEEIHNRTLSDGQAISGIVIEYTISMGVDPRVFVEASQAGPSEMRFFTDEEAVNYNIVTPRGFAPLFLYPEEDGLLAVSTRNGPTHPYDRATGVAFFCQSGRPGEAWIRMETDMPGGLEAELLADVFEAHLGIRTSDGADVDFSIAPESILADSGGSRGTHRWFIKVLKQEIRALLQADELGISARVPRAAGGYGSYHKLSDNDRLMIRSAFMNCI